MLIKVSRNLQFQCLLTLYHWSKIALFQWKILSNHQKLISHVKWAFSDQWVKKMSIFCFPFILLYSFLMFAIISVITMCFYGLSFNSGKQDLFKGTGLMAGVEVLAYFIILFTIDIAGRRPVLSFCQIFAGLSCLCSGFVPAEYFWPRFGFDQVVSSLKSSKFSTSFYNHFDWPIGD